MGNWDTVHKVVIAVFSLHAMLLVVRVARAFFLVEISSLIIFKFVVDAQEVLFHFTFALSHNIAPYGICKHDVISA
jgi:hypothetical protein